MRQRQHSTGVRARSTSTVRAISDIEPSERTSSASTPSQRRSAQVLAGRFCTKRSSAQGARPASKRPTQSAAAGSGASSRAARAAPAASAPAG